VLVGVDERSVDGEQRGDLVDLSSLCRGRSSSSPTRAAIASMSAAASTATAPAFVVHEFPAMGAGALALQVVVSAEADCTSGGPTGRREVRRGSSDMSDASWCVGVGFAGWVGPAL
jgi:hypothetical protein